MTIGHNRGPALEPDNGWQRHCWTQARAALLPHLPLEVLRGRLRRAAELGLDYRTYAGIRATTGRDVIAVLFSSNALVDTAGKLASLRGAGRIGLAIRPLSPPVLRRLVPDLDDAHPAPGHLAPHAEARARLRAALGQVPGDGAILIGAHGLEADWAVAARLAAYVPADRYVAS
jgi:hypothetical protein